LDSLESTNKGKREAC